jgi:predicted  nucleic acid-binding Zn-ribbon protein
MISQETARLNDVLRHKQEDIDKLNGNEAGYRKKIGDLQNQLRDAEEGGEKARLLEGQIQDLKNRCNKAEDQNR